MKKKIILMVLVVLLLSLTGYGTYAYTTVEGKATNVITSGGVDITLHEYQDRNGTPFPTAPVQGVAPSDIYTKIVQVENSGEHTAWVCARVDVRVKLADGSQGSTSPVSLDINKKFWTQGKDGLYYYKDKLAPGKFTEPLFTQVKFDPAMGNDYQGSTVTVNVQALATQTANNGDTVWQAEGWPRVGQK